MFTLLAAVVDLFTTMESLSVSLSADKPPSSSALADDLARIAFLAEYGERGSCEVENDELQVEWACSSSLSLARRNYT